MAAEVIIAVTYQRYLSALKFPGQVEDGHTPWLLDITVGKQDEELTELVDNLREEGEIELLFLGRLDAEKEIEGALRLRKEASS